MKLYLETSVISAYYRSTGSMRRITRSFFEKIQAKKFGLFTSIVTIEELDRTPGRIKLDLITLVERNGMRILRRTEPVIKLARTYVEAGMIPSKFKPDAEHIAIASINGVDVIASWNLEHIVKLKTKLMVKEINTELGYTVPAIVRPDEVI